MSKSKNSIELPEKQSAKTSSGMGGYRPGSGRKKGQPNKMTADVKAMILGALSDVGGQQYLADRAIDTPGPFMTLLGKILPTQVTGSNGGPIEVKSVKELTDAELMAIASASASNDAE